MFLPRTSRPTDVPDTGLICDLLWADPDKERIVMLWKWSRVRILPVFSSQCVAFRGQRWLELVRSFSQNFVFVMHMPQDIAGWAENDRGVSFIFGPDVVSTFLQILAFRFRDCTAGTYVQVSSVRACKSPSGPSWDILSQDMPRL